MHHNQRSDTVTVSWKSVQIRVSSEDPTAVETYAQTQGRFSPLMQHCHLLLTAASGVDFFQNGHAQDYLCVCLRQ